MLVAVTPARYHISYFVRSCFTGKERDTETGLDMSGTRYYGRSLGRFVPPPWQLQAYVSFSPIDFACVNR